MFEDESALEMLNLNCLEHPNQDLVGSYFINGSDPQKRELGKKKYGIDLQISLPWGCAQGGRSLFSMHRDKLFHLRNGQW